MECNYLFLLLKALNSKMPLETLESQQKQESQEPQEQKKPFNLKPQQQVNDLKILKHTIDKNGSKGTAFL